MELYSAELPTALDMGQLASLRVLSWDRHVSCKAAELLEADFNLQRWKQKNEQALPTPGATKQKSARTKAARNRSSLPQNQQIALSQASKNCFITSTLIPSSSGW